MADDFDEDTLVDAPLANPLWRELPPTLNLIADAVGRERGGVAAAVAIGLQYAGRKLYIPGDLREGHPLPALIGASAAQAVSRAFAGDTLIIPAAISGEKRNRQKAVVALRASGSSQADIAQQLGIDRRTVQRVLAKFGDPQKPG